MPYDDPKATHRYYYNLEGLWTECINVEDCPVFEQTHTVIYVDNFYELQKEFILTAINETKEIAVNKILKKHKGK